VFLDVVLLTLSSTDSPFHHLEFRISDDAYVEEAHEECVCLYAMGDPASTHSAVERRVDVPTRDQW